MTPRTDPPTRRDASSVPDQFLYERKDTMLNGYTIHVAAPTGPQRPDWIVRVYSDSDYDKHIHSSEGCATLQIGMREAERAIIEDMGPVWAPA